MKALPYLDIHTHRREDNPHFVSVASLSVEELLTQSTPFKFNSAGIHPWWPQDYQTQEIAALQQCIEEMAKSGKLWAIGETGIDRMYPEFLEQQVDLFKWHLHLANSLKLPVIIHNVRAGSDLLGLIKESKPETAWIFHDYRGNELLTRDLLRLHPDCYFSFGLSLDNSPQVRELLPLIPLDHFFLETDSQKHLDIHEIYLRASEILKMDLNFLKSQIWMNFNKLSKAKNDVMPTF